MFVGVVPLVPPGVVVVDPGFVEPVFVVDGVVEGVVFLEVELEALFVVFGVVFVLAEFCVTG